MRYQFTGTVKVQIKSYWVTHAVRAKASKLPLAMKQAVESVLKTNYKGKRITQVIVALERLGPCDVDVQATPDAETE
jgi:hypothetical protein